MPARKWLVYDTIFMLEWVQESRRQHWPLLSQLGERGLEISFDRCPKAGTDTIPKSDSLSDWRTQSQS